MSLDDNTPNQEPIPGDRGIPSINRERSLQSRLSSILAIGLMVALGVGILTWYYATAASRTARSHATLTSRQQSRATSEMTLPPLGHITAPPPNESVSLLQRTLAPPPALPSELLAPQPESPVRSGSARGVHVSGRGREDVALKRLLSGPAFANSALRSASTSATFTDGSDEGRSTPTEPLSNTAFAATGSAASIDPLTGLLKTAPVPTAHPANLPTQRLLLPKGAFIDCTLETAIDSNLPGMTTCITATDTFGMDGNVVLIERGTKLIGETRGQVAEGTARIFVVWTEARTPDGIVVRLASPGTDQLGRAGLSGAVNRHFLERFGAALLVSTIDAVIQSAVQPGNGGVIINPSTSENVLTEVLKQTLAIRPTISKHAGDRIQVLIARDIDFRSVYRLKHRAQPEVSS